MSKNASLSALAESMRPAPAKAESAPITIQTATSSSIKRVSLYLPPDLYKRVRWLSVENEQSMNELIIDAIQRRINNVKAS